MDSEHSYSGDSPSDSGSSSGSSDSEEESLEPVHILGVSLELPQELCEDYGIFKEFFSRRTWQTLDEEDQQHLKTFLPTIEGVNNDEQKEKTLDKLFDREIFCFTSPLDEFYSNLKQGNYRPDIAKMKKYLIKARNKQQKHKIKSYYAKLLPELLISRERLLAAAKSAPPGPIPRLPLLPPKLTSKNYFKSPHARARQRYFDELAAIRNEIGGELSDDENYPEGPPSLASKKRKQLLAAQTSDGNVTGTLGSTDPTRPTSLTCLKNILTAHRFRRRHRENHPELNTTGITLEDIKQRVALVNGTKKPKFGSQKPETPLQKLRRGAKKESAPKSKSQDMKPPKTAKVKDQDRPSESSDKHTFGLVKIKHEQDSDSESSSFVDPVTSPKQRIKKDIKQEVDIKYADDSSNVKYTAPKLEAKVKQEPKDLDSTLNQPRMTQPIPIKLEDLDGIDMMTLPVELADECEEQPEKSSHSRKKAEETVLAEADDSLMETTYANFLSLVRTLFPPRTAHRASRRELQNRCKALMRSPIAPLNTWYNLSDDWCAELDSALDFLSGEKGNHPDDFVPYLQFIPQSQMYQWIGAGRDCDANLGRLCERWLRARAAPLPKSPSYTNSATNDAPPARFPTTWTVRPPTSVELAEFRVQERRRFASAAKPFTYLQHGYRSVVGGCNRGPAPGAAHAALLVVERPRHATFLALVRDAVARLPNGEGTKHDIFLLLKMSQWIASCSDQMLSSALSSVLDRLNSAKRDPFLRYEQRTATWIYLHRHRCEEDWVKPTPARSRAKTATPVSAVPPSIPRSTPTTAVSTPVPVMDLEVSNVEEVLDSSDSDVDVDDSGSGSSAHQLSSAQLLMQATLTKPPPPPAPVTTKQKPKLVDVTRTKVGTSVAPTPSPSPSTPSKAKPKVHTQQQKVSTSQPAQQKPQPPQQKVVNQPSPQQKVVKSLQTAIVASVPKSSPSPVIKAAPVIKQRPVQKVEPMKQIQPVHTTVSQAASATVFQPVVTAPTTPISTKPVQATRSLLLRPTIAPNTTPVVNTVVSSPQVGTPVRRGVVRVLSPATPSSGKSLISPRALLQQGNPPPAVSAKRRVIPQVTASVTTVAQSTSSVTSLVSSAPTVVTCSVAPRTVQLAGGRTVQLGTNQTVQLPGGQTVQLTSGHTLQLSSLHLPTHSVRLPSGQTVQLATSQAIRSVATAPIKNPSPQSLPVKSAAAPQTSVQMPTVSTVQLTGQTVQIGGQTVQLAGQNLQLTGHTVKLPSGQSVQVTGQSVQLPSGQSVQLASGQTVQLASGQSVQTVQLAGHNVQLPSGQSVQLPSGQSVQLGSPVQLTGQTVQLAGGQTVQLPSGQTIQLPSGQTVQLSSGQTIQLSSGQTVQLASQLQSQKSATQHVMRTQTVGDKPLVAKLLTNAQGQMISLEGVVGGNRTLQLAGVRPQGQKTLQAVQGVSGIRMVPAATGRVTRPLLLTSAKPLHNIILQQSDGSALRVTSSGGVTPTQTIVLGNIGSQSGSASSGAPVLKLQQVNPIQQVKLSQGIKIQQAGGNVASSSGAMGAVRGVLMDGQQLKLVTGKHVLARLLRPAQHPP